MLLNQNFLLENKWAQQLYTKYAQDVPIIDYHCHLDAKDIYKNTNYLNITRIWLNENSIGDHYKWRLMRANGVDESYITGNGDDFIKLEKFCETIEKAIGNPIYEWSHLELKRYFGIDTIICKNNAKEIWDKANELLATPQYKVRELLKKMQVQCVVTTDDPADSLEYHHLLRKEELNLKVLPGFRPDNAIDITSSDFLNYLEKLKKSTQLPINSFADLQEVMSQRVEYFHECGCRISDHGLNTFYFTDFNDSEVETIFQKALKNQPITLSEVVVYQSAMLMHFMTLYTKHNWTVQLHMNVFRNASAVNLKNIGINSGFDSVGSQSELSKEVLKLLQQAQLNNVLPKVILYSLDPSDWLALATLMANFQGDGIVQRLQLGCAWWFNDTYEGMKQQLTIFASQSLLGNFVGMLTDSRSFLSYTRHEYFRRILCNLVGSWIESGRLPEDMDYIGKIIKDICYFNAHKYFGFFN